MTHSFVCKLYEEDDQTLKFKFYLDKGEQNEGLLKTVFGEFIEEPILKRLVIGEPFIRFVHSPILDGMIHYSVDSDIISSTIRFSLTSIYFRNRLVDKVDEEKVHEHFYLKFPDGVLLELENATDKSIPQIMFALVIKDILNGMKIDVDIKDYYPNCKNCAMNIENLRKYLKLGDESIQMFFDVSKSGCLFELDIYDERGEEIECARHVRKTYPNIKSLLDTVSIFPKIENI